MALFNRTAPCPYCYHSINPSALDFRCAGRPAPGKQACAVNPDETRIAVLSDATPVRPTFRPEKSRFALVGTGEAQCPECMGTTRVRVCPACHSVMPVNFSAESPLFGLVGVRGSGKTVMLTVLHKELTSTVARRFDASIDVTGNSPLVDKLDKFLATMNSTMGELPPQTATYNARETVPAVFEWQYSRPGLANRKRETSTIFSFYDTSGEDLATAERAREQHYLAATDGLILLLDPFALAENRDRAFSRGVDPENMASSPETVLRSITTMLQEAENVRPNKKIKRPIAVVVAKIDAFFDQLDPDDPLRQPATFAPYFDEAQSRDLHHRMAALLDSWGGDAVLRTLEHNYQTYRLFGASALGAEPEYGTRRVNSKGVLPHRVAEPLLWLMAERGFIPKEA